MRHGFAPLIVLLTLCGTVRAESWADKMFSERSHDFGNVPRGADVQHQFVIRNPFQVPVRISKLKRTCGCTQTTLNGNPVLSESRPEAKVKLTLQPNQEAILNLTLDTRKFVREKSAELTVWFDKPRRANVRLTVRSFIRQDVVLNPGAIQFGTVSRDKLEPKSLLIEYAGELHWKIQDVAASDDRLKVSVEESYRKPGRVGYKLTVTPDKTATPGSIHSILTVQTNDPASPRVAIMVEGQVLPSLIVTPSNLSLGSIAVNQPAVRRILLRGNEPFKILAVEGANDKFEAKYSTRSQKFHTVTVSFLGSDSPQTIRETLQIKTDLADEPPTPISLIGTVR